MFKALASTMPYKRKARYSPYQVAKRAARDVMSDMVETKSGVKQVTDGQEIEHNNFVMVSSSPFATSHATGDPETSQGQRLGDAVTLQGLAIKGFLELNERYSDVTFRLMFVRSAKGDTPTTSTLFNGASGNKMLDSFNRERFTLLSQKYVKIRAFANTAAMNGNISMNEPLGVGTTTSSGVYSANGGENNNAISRYTKMFKMWVPGHKVCGRDKTLVYEDNSQQPKFFDYHFIIYAYSNYSTSSAYGWNVGRLNDCYLKMYFKDA